MGCSRGGPSRGCGLGTRLDIGGPGREGGGGSGRVRGLAWIQVELKRTRGAGKGDRLDGRVRRRDFTWLPHIIVQYFTAVANFKSQACKAACLR